MSRAAWALVSKQKVKRNGDISHWYSHCPVLPAGPLTQNKREKRMEFEEGPGTLCRAPEGTATRRHAMLAGGAETLGVYLFVKQKLSDQQPSWTSRLLEEVCL